MLVTNGPLVVDAARVVVPFTDKLRPEVVWALQEAEVDFEPFDVSASDEAYWQLLSYLWRCGETFAVVEHDIVVTPGVLASFGACAHEWCVAKYPYLRSTYWGLGCSRFRASLLERIPDLMERVGQYDAPNHGPRHWCTLDQAVTTELRSERVDWPHQDHGEVAHLGDNLPAHGCRT